MTMISIRWKQQSDREFSFKLILTLYGKKGDSFTVIGLYQLLVS